MFLSHTPYRIQAILFLLDPYNLLLFILFAAVELLQILVSYFCIGRKYCWSVNLSWHPDSCRRVNAGVMGLVVLGRWRLQLMVFSELRAFEGD